MIEYFLDMFLDMDAARLLQILVDCYLRYNYINITNDFRRCSKLWCKEVAPVVCDGHRYCAKHVRKHKYGSSWPEKIMQDLYATNMKHINMMMKTGDKNCINIILTYFFIINDAYYDQVYLMECFEIACRNVVCEMNEQL